MNNRKKHVMDQALELFIKNGFQSTSIQEIIETSGISKGTFYNYFSSKNTLLIAIFNDIYANLENQRKKLLIGKDKTDVSIFIKQIEMLIKTNSQYKVVPLFEEILFINDVELKGFMEKRRIQELNWIYHRLIDILGPDKEAYLLDCSIMLIGILHNHITFYSISKTDEINITQIVQYSVNRVMDMIKVLTETNEVLLNPSYLFEWTSDDKEEDNFRKKLQCMLEKLKFSIRNISRSRENIPQLDEMIDFIYKELNGEYPRQYIIQSVWYTLRNLLIGTDYKELIHNIEEIMNNHFYELK